MRGTQTRRRPRYADVAATLALIVALGGTSYAVAALPRNSVGTAQIKARAVTKGKLATGLSTAGPRGAAGATGPAGAAGAPGLSGVEIVTGGDGYTSSAQAVCPAGKRAIGGGAVSGGVSPVYLTRSFPAPDGASWLAGSAGASPSGVTAYAVCAIVSP